jgi:hypothetical protein
LVASQTPEIHKKTELKSIRVEKEKKITAVEKKQRKQVLEFEANEIAKMAPASVSQTMPWQTSYKPMWHIRKNPSNEFLRDEGRL